MSSARSALFSVLVCLVVTAGAGGCRPMFEPFVGTVPHVDGRWVGVLKAVTVGHQEGKDVEAVALEISEGPRMPYTPGGGYDYVAADRLALLSESRQRPLFILSPEGLTMGSAVEVRGTMKVGRLHTGSPTSGGSPVSAHPDESRGDLIILLRGQPKVLATDHGDRH